MPVKGPRRRSHLCHLKRSRDELCQAGQLSDGVFAPNFMPAIWLSKNEFLAAGIFNLGFFKTDYAESGADFGS